MKVKLNNVGVIKECEVEFTPGITIILGSSGSGKSTLMRSVYNMATNGFSDCDISFGENTMNVFIECDGNVVEYIRNIKAKGDRFYYIVNGETYSKVGRTSLPQVSDTLKISDLCVNGEDVNFNFNLQFSTPFLILGSQSTLYNVLTYRSSFDISSINDYYKLDIKNNENEISTNIKVKERLECTLSDLESKADQLSSIEKIYSDYTACKHTSCIVDELNDINDKLVERSEILKTLNYVSECISSIECSTVIASKLIELLKFKDLCCQYEAVINNYNSTMNLLHNYENAISYSSKLCDMYKLLNTLQSVDRIDNNIEIICDCFNSYCNILNKEEFIKDLIKQVTLISKYNSCCSIVNATEMSDTNDIFIIEELISLSNKYENMNIINNSLNNIISKESSILKELSAFSICPLCGGALHNV